MDPEAQAGSDGVATFTTTSLGLGVHFITAAYAGSTNFSASTSAALTQTISQANSPTILLTALTPGGSGQSVTFTATVSPVAPGAGTPTGSVTFRDGSNALGTATLNASGMATFTTAALSAGAHTITAVYAGDTSFSTSTSAALTQTVTKANTTVTLASSLNPSLFGQAVTLTATVAAVAPGAGIPTGTVT